MMIEKGGGELELRGQALDPGCEREPLRATASATKLRGSLAQGGDGDRSRDLRFLIGGIKGASSAVR